MDRRPHAGRCRGQPSIVIAFIDSCTGVLACWLLHVGVWGRVVRVRRVPFGVGTFLSYVNFWILPRCAEVQAAGGRRPLRGFEFRTHGHAACASLAERRELGFPPLRCHSGAPSYPYCERAIPRLTTVLLYVVQQTVVRFSSEPMSYEGRVSSGQALRTDDDKRPTECYLS
eukprot:1313951-Prymnesium_polylepis.2